MKYTLLITYNFDSDYYIRQFDSFSAAIIRMNELLNTKIQTIRRESEYEPCVKEYGKTDICLTYAPKEELEEKNAKAFYRIYETSEAIEENVAYYISKYLNVLQTVKDTCNKQADKLGIPEEKRDFSEAYAKAEADMTTDEVVGFYLFNCYEKPPYTEWLKATEHIKGRNAQMQQVDAILKDFSFKSHVEWVHPRVMEVFLRRGIELYNPVTETLLIPKDETRIKVYHISYKEACELYRCNSDSWKDDVSSSGSMTHATYVYCESHSKEVWIPVPLFEPYDGKNIRDVHTAVKMKQAIEKLDAIDREDWGNLSLLIADNASNEAYENDKSLHNLFHKYKNDNEKLLLIDEVLICICGWGLSSLVSKMEEKDDD